jgi:signal transduction histidine kinase
VRALAVRLRRLPLRVRLTLAGTLLLPVALGVVFGLVYLRFEGGLNSTIDGDLRARADTLAVTLRGRDTAALNASAATELLRPLGAFAQVVDRRGRVLSSSDAVTRVRLLTPAQAARATRHELRIDRGRIAFVAKRSRLVAVPLDRGATALVVGRSLKDREGANESFGRALLIGGPLAVLLSAAACYLAAAAALRPVETMRRRAAQITGPDLSARLPVPEADDEISRLGRTLNDMLDRLEEAVARQREITQTASHELRTPLTVLSTEIEVALQHDLDDASRSAMTVALHEAQRVGSLADDLLALAQFEEQALPLAIETVDLDEVVRLATARAARRQADGARAVVVHSETLIADADPTRIEQAVGNLVDNALAHGRGTVTVTLRCAGNAVEIAVEDEGAGIPASLGETAFERFTTATAGGRHGAGLGLAIVRAIAEAHGGTAHFAPDRPSRIVVDWPGRR